LFFTFYAAAKEDGCDGTTEPGPCPSAGLRDLSDAARKPKAKDHHQNEELYGILWSTKKEIATD